MHKHKSNFHKISAHPFFFSWQSQSRWLLVRSSSSWCSSPPHFQFFLFFCLLLGFYVVGVELSLEASNFLPVVLQFLLFFFSSASLHVPLTVPFVCCPDCKGVPQTESSHWLYSACKLCMPLGFRVKKNCFCHKLKFIALQSC